MKICDWCSNEFQPNVVYQIYCSSECRENATKEKVNERYKKKKREKLSLKLRLCSNNCGTVLSIYNDTGICGSCVVDDKEVSKALRQLRGLIEYQKFSE